MESLFEQINQEEINPVEKDANILIKFWDSLFIPCKNIKTVTRVLEEFYQIGYSLKDIERGIYEFKECLEDEKYFLKRLPKSFLTLDFIMKTKPSVLKKNATFLRKRKIEFNSNSILYDILHGSTFLYLERFLTPDIFKVNTIVGNPIWEIQRVAEIIGFSYSLYCEKYDQFSYNNFLGTEEYIKTLDTVSVKLWKFLTRINKDIKIYPKIEIQYFYLLERPYSFLHIFIKFIEDEYGQDSNRSLELNWIGSNVFNKILNNYLENNGYFKREESNFGKFSSGKYGKAKLSRREYRKIAKKTKTIYSGDVKNTSEFKKMVNLAK